MMRWKSILLFVAIFALGVIAGFGIGNLYGGNSYNAQLERKVTDLQSRFQTANENYLTLAREYNKLFTLRASSVGDANPVSAATSPAATKPAGAPADAKATPTATKPAATPATKATVAATSAPSSSAPAASGGKIKANFKALAVDGTGPLEGPPPLVVKFTDTSTGTITSWKWEFGDGTTSTEQNPQHKYEKACPGDKQLCTVKLTVCGPDGCVTISKPDYLWISESCTGC